MLKVYRAYLAPGLVFASVLVGGGHGTGREIVEYFTQYGFWGGLLAILTAWSLMALVLTSAFEFARAGRFYDYRSFIRGLLGRFWPVFEIMMIFGMILILAVLAAAASEIFADSFNLPTWLGVAILGGLIAVLGLVGRETITVVLSLWTVALYGVFIAMLAIALYKSGANILPNAAAAPILDGWFISGLKYTSYNVVIVALLLYPVRHIETSRQAIGAGIIAATIGLTPGIVFHLAFFTGYPEVVDQSLPVYWLIGQLSVSGLLIIYSIAFLGTLVETGAGALQGIFDRIEGARLEHKMNPLPHYVNALIACVVFAASVALSQVGVIALVAVGYGLSAWILIVIFIIPLLTIAAIRVFRNLTGK